MGWPVVRYVIFSQISGGDGPVVHHFRWGYDLVEVLSKCDTRRRFCQRSSFSQSSLTCKKWTVMSNIGCGQVLQI